MARSYLRTATMLVADKAAKNKNESETIRKGLDSNGLKEKDKTRAERILFL